MEMTSKQLQDVYAENSCGMTRSQWAETHRRSGYVLGNARPADFITAQLSRCSPEIMALADGVLGGTATGAVFAGRAGRGKTYAACAVMRHSAEIVSVGLATDAELIRKAKAAFNDRTATEEGIIAAFVRPYLLTLDDFGKASYTSDWATQLAFEVIDQRIKQRRPTIITTQYGAAQLVEKLTVNGDATTAEAIASRMRLFPKVKFDGIDLRGRDARVALR